MEEIKWKDSLNVKDMRESMPINLQSQFQMTINLMAKAIGWAPEQVEEMHLGKFLEYSKILSKKYGINPAADFLG